MSQKSLTISQILTTLHHDGRFVEAKGQAELESLIGDRVWRMDGVEFADAVFVGTINSAFVTLPSNRYRELLEAEQKLKDQNDARQQP